MDWKMVLTSTVISALITTIIGSILKGRFDRRLESDKQNFEKEKAKTQMVTQRELEYLKNEISQISLTQQKNLDYFHASQQVSLSKRVEAINSAWTNYLDLRVFMSPLINFYSILLPDEYLLVFENEPEKDHFNLKSLDEREFIFSMDVIPQLLELESRRPLLGEVIYIKLKSAFLFLLRLRYIFETMKRKNEVQYWHTDLLMIDHIKVVLSDKNIDVNNVDISSFLNSPINLGLVISLLEREINQMIGKVITGEESANLSLERADRLKLMNKGYR